MSSISLVTVLVTKGNLICLPLGIGDIVHPGAIGGQKGFIKMVTLQGMCLTGHRPVGRLKCVVTMCQRRAIAASPASLQVIAVCKGVTCLARRTKGVLISLSVSLPTSILLSSPELDVELSELERSSGE